MGEHPGFDRIVLDLQGPVPDLDTRYARRLRHEGSGIPVPIRGRSGIRLGVALRQLAPHRVVGLTSPPRLVFDVRHP